MYSVYIFIYLCILRETRMLEYLATCNNLQSRLNPAIVTNATSIKLIRQAESRALEGDDGFTEPARDFLFIFTVGVGMEADG